MLKLTKTGIGLLTRQYRSVLKKCWAINIGIFALSSMAAMIPSEAEAVLCYVGSGGGSGQQVVYYDGYTCPSGKTLVSEYGSLSTDKISIGSDGDGGNINFYDVNGTRTAQLTNTYDTSGGSKYAQLRFFDPSGSIYTYLDYESFKLNGSTEMTGITHNAVVTANASSTVAKLVSESTLARSLNNYYRKNKKSGILNGFEEGKIGNEIGDNFSKSAQNIKAVNDNFVLKNDSFLTNNGDFASNNLSRLGAFSKCEKACPRPSERFPASLEKNSAFERYSRSARGTFLFVSQTHKNVLDNFSQNIWFNKTGFKVVANDNFATTTFLRAI